MHWYNNTPWYRKGVYKVPRASWLGSSRGVAEEKSERSRDGGKELFTAGRGVCVAVATTGF